MSITSKKRPYSIPETVALSLENSTSLLAGSIIDSQIIESTGQELGPIYQLSGDTDENTGKTFSHEWETSWE